MGLSQALAELNPQTIPRSSIDRHGVLFWARMSLIACSAVSWTVIAGTLLITLWSTPLIY